MKTWKLLLVFAVLIFFALTRQTSAQVQTSTKSLENLSLEDLLNIDIEVVTASKASEKIQDAPALVSVITAQEIRGYGAMSLYEVLDRAVSTYFTSLYNTGKNGLTIRGDNTGSYNTHILILMNGRPIRESLQSGHDNAIYITFPLNRIERLEIIRGPGSVLYGTNAYIGVINIITEKTTASSLETKLRYGAFNTVQGEISGSTTLGDVGVAANLFYLKNTGWDYVARGEGDIIRNKANTRDSIIKPPTAKKFDDFGWGATLQATYKDFKLQGFYGFSNQGSWGRQPDWRNRPVDFLQENVRGMVDAGYTHTFSSAWTATFNLTYNHEEWRMRHPSDSTKDDLIRAKSDDFLIEWTNFIKPLDNLNIVIGGTMNNVTGQVLQPDLDSNGITFNIYRAVNPKPFAALPSYNLMYWGLYAQADYTPMSFWKIIVGAQVNKVPEVSIDIVPRLGSIFTLSDALKAKILFGQAFRTASIFERNVWTPPVTAGNTLLRPEKVSTFETQLIYSQSSFEVALTYFRSFQNDLIFRSSPADSLVVVEFPVGSKQRVSIPQYINRGNQTSQGVEFEGQAAVSRELIVSASATYQTSTDDQGQIDVMGMPKLMAKIGLQYTPISWLKLGIFNSYFGTGGDTKAYDKNGNPVTLIANPDAAAYNYLTANITANIASLLQLTSLKTLAVNVYGTNLFDASIWNPEVARRRINTIPGRPGRAVYATLIVGW